MRRFSFLHSPVYFVSLFLPRNTEQKQKTLRTSPAGSVRVHDDAHGPPDSRRVRGKRIRQLGRLKCTEACGLVPTHGVVVGVDFAEAAHHVKLVGGAVVLGCGGGGGAVVGAGLWEGTGEKREGDELRLERGERKRKEMGDREWRLSLARLIAPELVALLAALL